MKQLLLILTLVVLVVANACSSGSPRCLKSNCNGCCDVNGMCQMGNESFACGFGANMCGTCAQNERCTNNQCVAGDGGTGTGGGSGGAGGSSGCNASNCGGCCDNMGTCRGGNTNTFCGNGGIGCNACPMGQACTLRDGGTFVCAQYTCPGCIGSTGSCLPGNSQGACGNDAGMCKACLTGESCSSGSCVMATGCNAGNCAAGCCNGNVCVDPPTMTQCGRMGGTCTNCPGGQTCNAGTGTCQVGGTGGGSGGTGGGTAAACNTTNCQGCCAFDTCFPGTSDVGCGKNAESCNICPTPIKFYCRNQACTFVP